MDKPLTREQKNILIEEALHTYPMRSMPRDITSDVMARIQTIPTSNPFRLARMDIVLGIVLSLCMGAVWFSLSQLPPFVLAQIRKETILLYQHIFVNARWLLPAVSFGLAAFISALTIPYLSQELTKANR